MDIDIIEANDYGFEDLYEDPRETCEECRKPADELLWDDREHRDLIVCRDCHDAWQPEPEEECECYFAGDVADATGCPVHGRAA